MSILSDRYDVNGEGYEVDDTCIVKQEKGFLPYSEEIIYEVNTKDLSYHKNKACENKIFNLLTAYPLLTKEVLCDILGEGASDVIDKLYDDGMLSRFAGRKPYGENAATVNCYFVSENARNTLHLRNIWGEIEDMSVPMRLEIAALSKWCSYTLKNGQHDHIRIQYYGKADSKDHPYLEVVIKKKIRQDIFHSIPCTFHIVCRPKSEDRMIPFLGTLLRYNEIIDQEEQRSVTGKSFVVILCESDDNMEHFSVELNHLFRSRKIDVISSQRFLFSLEEDSIDDKGAFKFLHLITFPDATIRRQQVAFR